MTTVAAAMIHRPKVCGPGSTVADARAEFADDHVHAVLVADRGDLLAVVERGDLDGVRSGLPARECGRLAGRVVGPDADLEGTWRGMAADGRRRLAVVGPGGTLLGLLCLKRSGRGFCTDDDVAARAAELGRELPDPLDGRLTVTGAPPRG